MIAIKELKDIYKKVPRDKKAELVTELSTFFNVTEETIKTHYLCRWRLPVKAYKEQARKDFKRILLMYVS